MAVPVLIGVGSVSCKLDDPLLAPEAWRLMLQAAEQSLADAGVPALASRLDAIRVPKGLWAYSDPARLVARALGSPRARTTLAEVGILQTHLLAEACLAIQQGREQVSLVLGGEAKYRQVRAAKTGQPAPETVQTETPDDYQVPEAELWSAAEWEHGLGMPVNSYAVLENALRRAEGLSLDAHRAEIAGLWAGFNRVAQGNAEAWFGEPMDAQALMAASVQNRPLAFPYHKWHTAQWTVDQAAALLLCSETLADELGIPAEQRIYPLGIAESQHAVPVSARRDLHRCPGYRLGGEALEAATGLRLADVPLLELYSCFPIAVRIQQRELGLDPARPATVTGGMSFAGGPLNNFVYQALVAVVRRLRAEGGTALVTAVSGLLTKQGLMLWGKQRPERAFAYTDVSAQVQAATPVCTVHEKAVGPARIAGYTVLYDRDGQPERAVVIADLPDGSRALTHSDDRALARAMTEVDPVGRAIVMDDDPCFRLS